MKLKFVDAEKFYNVYDFLTENEIEESKAFVEADFSFFDGEVLFSYHSGCMILRYYSDGVGYHFDAPFSISEIADMESAFAAISEYCKKEAIPEVVVGIEPELKNMMLRGATHYLEREDDDGTFVIEIQTECMTEEYLPEILDLIQAEVIEDLEKEKSMLSSPSCQRTMSFLNGVEARFHQGFDALVRYNSQTILTSNPILLLEYREDGTPKTYDEICQCRTEGNSELIDGILKMRYPGGESPLRPRPVHTR